MEWNWWNLSPAGFLPVTIVKGRRERTNPVKKYIVKLPNVEAELQLISEASMRIDVEVEEVASRETAILF